jgi:3-methyladenine DNA glycosylase AlkD
MNREITFPQIMDQLLALENTINIAGQRRFGIRGEHMLGISIENLRRIARGVRDHELAALLWATGIHDARLLASMVDDPHLVTVDQMNSWVIDFDSWELCDQVTNNLFPMLTGFGSNLLLGRSG